LKLSKYLVATLKEAPNDAETQSHKLMIRAGMIRKVAAGIYNFMPLGLRVFRKVEKIIREEMNNSDAIEVMMPFVTPADLWIKSGRWDIYGKELLRLKDRADRDFCLGPTHEEVVTDLVDREVKSYKNLPLNIYQIQPKFRDEIRPRFGVMRAREFVMKDAYSFDVDEKAADESYSKMFTAYQNIFKRCGLEFRAVEADSGNIGGSSSHEFMVIADTGEDTIMVCDKCDFAANVETTPVIFQEEDLKSENHKKNAGAGKETPEIKIEKISTPSITSVKDLANFLGIPEQRIVKTMIVSTDQGLEALLIRGDHEISLTKYKKERNLEFVELANDKEIDELKTAKGFTGPIALDVKIFADNAIKNLVSYVAGSNEKDFHLLNVNHNKDFKITKFFDAREAMEGDRCRCSVDALLSSTKGIEVGHVFKLGTKYSEAMKAGFTDASGKNQNFFMGCYGIGVGRVVAAAIEQNNDEKGISLPLSIAPFEAIVIQADKKNEEVLRVSEEIYNFIKNKGIDVALDDRAESPGIKFKDAELIGIPYQIVIGPKSLAKDVIEFKNRRTNIKEEIPIDNLNKLFELINEE
jgi:prolyl-tRNA synthetase|tara:strand:- start:1285 stop:3024 length:1740 start_codon:yes stop_codon:yes gene_type:complete